MKQYQKPDFYENFVLAEHIALCANKLGATMTFAVFPLLKVVKYDDGITWGFFAGKG